MILNNGIDLSSLTNQILLGMIAADQIAVMHGIPIHITEIGAHPQPPAMNAPSSAYFILEFGASVAKKQFINALDRRLGYSYTFEFFPNGVKVIYDPDQSAGEQ